VNVRAGRVADLDAVFGALRGREQHVNFLAEGLRGIENGFSGADLSSGRRCAVPE